MDRGITGAWAATPFPRCTERQLVELLVMTLQNYPRNPIEQRKAAVRKYTRNGVIAVGTGVAGGVVLAVLLHSWLLLALGLVLAVVGGFANYSRVQKIINHKDEF